MASKPKQFAVMVNKASYTKAELIAKFRACEGLYDAEEAATLAATKATEARAAVEAEIGPFATGLGSMLVTMLGPDEAASCGVEVSKEKTPLTVEAQGVRVAKMIATRHARGTMGKKQKLAIKGKLPEGTKDADAKSGGAGTDVKP